MWWLLLAVLGFAGGVWLGGATVTLLGYVFVLPGAVCGAVYSKLSGKSDDGGITILFSLLFWTALIAFLYFAYWRG